MSKKANQTIDLDFLRGEGTRTDLSGMFAASVTAESEMQQAIMIKIDRLLNNPYQPRDDMREDTIGELSQVIKAQGFQGVLIARPHPSLSGSYELTAGHRRREAARRAGLSTLPVVVRDLTDEEMVTLAVTENIQREDLSPLEEGKIYLMMSQEMGYTQEQIAREVGKKRGYVENRIRVARAPKDVQALVQAKPDSIRAVANLIKLKDEQDRAEIIDGMLSGELTVEDLPALVLEKAAIRDARKANAAAQKVFDQIAAKEAARQAKSATSIPEDEVVDNGDMSIEVGGAEALSEQPDSQPALAAQAAAKAGSSERKEARIGNAKLAAVLRYLNTYKEQSASRQTISEQERASLALIKATVEQLYDRFGTQDTDDELLS